MRFFFLSFNKSYYSKQVITSANTSQTELRGPSAWT